MWASDELARIRRARGLSQRRFADKVGVKLRTLRGIEGREYRAKPGTLKLLADGLGVSVAAITTPAPARGWLTFAEAISRAGEDSISQRRIREALQAQELKAEGGGCGSDWRINPEDLEAWIRRENVSRTAAAIADLKPMRSAARATKVRYSIVCKWRRQGRIREHGRGANREVLVSCAEILAAKERHDRSVGLYEAMGRLGMGYARVRALMDDGHLEFEQFDREVEIVTASIERLEQLISFADVERNGGPPGWVLERWGEQGVLTIERRGYLRMVDRAAFQALLEKLVADPALCPVCTRPTRPGRSAHRECASEAGGLAAAAAWHAKSPEEREWHLSRIIQGLREWWDTPPGLDRRVVLRAAWSSRENSERTRESNGDRYARAFAVVEALKADRDLIDTSELCELFGVARCTVTGVYVVNRYVPAEKHVIEGFRFWLYSREEADRRRREWLRVPPGSLQLAMREAWLDPEFVIQEWERRGWLARQAERMGVSEKVVAAVVRDQVRARRKRFMPHKSGLPPAPKERWIATGVAVLRDTPWLTFNQLLREIFRRDWLAHRDDWPGYPADPTDPRRPHPKWRKPAVDRIRRQIGRELKALQIPATN